MLRLGSCPVAVLIFILLVHLADTKYQPAVQKPIQVPQTPATNKSISVELFRDLEELSRIVDIAYCVGAVGPGIQNPFCCPSHCQDFKHFELVTTWNTGLLFSDNCGYLALSHPPAAPRIILAFRGTYSLANTVTDLSTLPQEYTPYPGQKECANCTVHAGFINSWTLTKPLVVNHLETLRKEYPGYQLTLVGHSLGGAIAALASLDFQAVGWKPKVTTFGEPKVGNIHLVQYFDRLFRSNQSRKGGTYRRVTHVGDPIPLLPLDEMGFRAHAGEIFISKPEIRPEVTDLYRCDGDDDPECIAGSMTQLPGPRWFRRLLARLRVWQLFTAHRDYFWRLGLCVSGGDPTS